MKVVEISSFGDANVLQLAERARPEIAGGEVLIRVSAFGVNRPDILQRKGLYPPPPGASDIPGLEVAGTIEAGDSEDLAAAGLKRHDPVCALVAGGGYAEYCVAPIGQCLPIPHGLDHVQAASLPETFFTVWSNVFDRAKLAYKETLLVHGGSSGIGVTAIQLAKAHGAKVIVTVGSSEKAAACLALGADHAINYKTEDFPDQVNRMTGGQGVNVILDMVAGPYVSRELPCLAEDGRLVIIAVQGGRDLQVDAVTLMTRRLTLTGSTLRARSVAFKAAIAKSLRDRVWPWLAAGQVRPVIHQVFPAAQVAQAHAVMESNQHIGKLVLAW